MLRETADRALTARLFDKSALDLATPLRDGRRITPRTSKPTLGTREESFMTVLGAFQVGPSEPGLARSLAFPSANHPIRLQIKATQPIPDRRVSSAELIRHFANGNALLRQLAQSNRIDLTLGGMTAIACRGQPMLLQPIPNG